MNTQPTTIEEYISAQSEDAREMLTLLHKTIKAEIPEAVEILSYAMPAFQLYGKNAVYFAAGKHHIGFYPTPSIITAFKDDLKDYKYATGSVQFPKDKPLPVELIRKMVQFRAQEMKEKYGK